MHAEFSDCPICGDINHICDSSGVAGLFGPAALENAILWRDTDLFLLPAPGCFVTGYLILATINHFLSFASLDNHVLGKVDTIWASIRDQTEHLGLGNYVLFEHGSGAHSRGSACVEHAHLHMVPCRRPRELIEALQKFFSSEAINHVSDLGNVYDGQPYIVIAFNSEVVFFRTPVVISQLSRRIVANQWGLGDQWNWREYPQRDNFFSTLELFQRLIRQGELIL